MATSTAASGAVAVDKNESDTDSLFLRFVIFHPAPSHKTPMQAINIVKRTFP